jgi:hypothetical protein
MIDRTEQFGMNELMRQPLKNDALLMGRPADAQGFIDAGIG